MAVRIKLDTVASSRIRIGKFGVEIIRGGQAFDLDIAAGTSDPAALLKVMNVPGMPQIGMSHPDANWAYCLVEDIIITSIDWNKRAAQFEILYRSPVYGGSQQEPTWIVNDSTQHNSIQTSLSAPNLNVPPQRIPITVQYAKGWAPGSPQTIPTSMITAGTGTVKNARVPKIATFRVLTATSVMTKDQWDSLKTDFRAAAEKINKLSWGSSPRGTWLFLGPQSTFQNNSTRGTVVLPFLYDRYGHFPISLYFDRHGDHPTDCTSEETLRDQGFPAQGSINQMNGITMSSIYEETDFSVLFDFTPDD